MPALDEEEAVPNLISEIEETFSNTEINYEIVIIDDGSNKILSEYISEKKSLKIIRNSYSLGQSESIFKGISESSYNYIATLDADGQNPPSELLKLVNYYNSNFPEFDIIAGIRTYRKDTFFRSTYSKVANFLIRFITKSTCQDLGCALKIFRKEMVENIQYNGDIHRILIPLLEYRNYSLGQINVEHKRRTTGKTKYGIGRVVAVLVDSLLLYITKGMTHTTRYALGRFAGYFLMISLTLFSVAGFQKYYLSIFVHKNPLFLIGLSTFFIYLQLLMTSIISFFIENKTKN
tara:strand:- start:1324 stop:2196 length:873 start_codon:yes stop_codon:yes gene_type:complete